MEEVLIVKISRGAYSLAEILTTKRFRRIEYCPERNEFKIWERSYRRLEIKKGTFGNLVILDVKADRLSVMHTSFFVNDFRKEGGYLVFKTSSLEEYVREDLIR
ncbi:MAG: hypothetical protein ACTSXX_14930 [Candidatus Baldrarchaeia archaeon]